MHAATFFDGEGWRDGILELVDGRMLLLSDATPAHDLRFSGLPRLDGVIVGGFTDHHVHLQLVDHTLLHGSALGGVVDLGANPTVIAAYADAARFVSVAGAPSLNERQDAAPRPHNHQHDAAPWSLSERSETKRPHAVAVEFAGAFLTPVGGYPSDRDWAPAGSFREIADAAAAGAAVAEMADAGATCIKVASNTDAGPVFTDDLFRAIVDAASARGLPVVAHAQGSGEAQRVARLGAAQLAHAPFTERLDDAEIATQAASIAWISTLSIHDGNTPDERNTLATAVDNVRRFHAAGGTVLYGTDMGNGPTPVGLNLNELAALRDAGITGTALLRALAPQDPRDTESTLLRLPGTEAGTDGDPTLARPLTSADLKAMT